MFTRRALRQIIHQKNRNKGLLNNNNNNNNTNNIVFRSNKNNNNNTKLWSFNHSRNRTTVPRRNADTAKSADKNDEPLFEMKTKIKMGVIASGGILFYLYKKINKSPSFRDTLNDMAPGTMGALSSIITLDAVKWSDVRPETVWDDIDEWGKCIDYEIGEQMVTVTTLKSLKSQTTFQVKAGPYDTSETLRDGLVKQGMSIDDQVIDVTIHDRSSKNSSQRSDDVDSKAIDEHSNVDNVMKNNEILINEKLMKLREKEKELQYEISQFKKIEGGKTKVFMLEAAVKKIQGEKQFLKSQLT